MRSTIKYPVVELLIPLQEFSEPETNGSRFPRDLLPGLWYASIIHAVQSISEIFGHDYGPLELYKIY